MSTPRTPSPWRPEVKPLHIVPLRGVGQVPGGDQTLPAINGMADIGRSLPDRLQASQPALSQMTLHMLDAADRGTQDAHIRTYKYTYETEQNYSIMRMM